MTLHRLLITAFALTKAALAEEEHPDINDQHHEGMIYVGRMKEDEATGELMRVGFEKDNGPLLFPFCIEFWLPYELVCLASRISVRL